MDAFWIGATAGWIAGVVFTGFMQVAFLLVAAYSWRDKTPLFGGIVVGMLFGLVVGIIIGRLL